MWNGLSTGASFGGLVTPFPAYPSVYCLPLVPARESMIAAWSSGGTGALWTPTILWTSPAHSPLLRDG